MKPFQVEVSKESVVFLLSCEVLGLVLCGNHNFTLSGTMQDLHLLLKILLGSTNSIGSHIKYGTYIQTLGTG